MTRMFYFCMQPINAPLGRTPFRLMRQSLATTVAFQTVFQEAFGSDGLEGSTFNLEENCGISGKAYER
jgi:hypothetical protein